MKINWGFGVVIAFVLFASFILYFVVKVQSNPKYDNELVVEEYYKKDMRYSEEMQQLQNAASLAEKPQIISAAQGVAIRFPDAMHKPDIHGKVFLYRPSASKLDFEVPIAEPDSLTLIPDSFLAGGQWIVTLQWNYDGKTYMMKKKIYRKP